MDHLVSYKMFESSSLIAEIKPVGKREWTSFCNKMDKLGPPPEESNLLDGMLTTNNDKRIGAFLNGTIVGVASYDKHARISDATEIRYIFVQYDKRSSDVGKMLVDAIALKSNSKMLVTNPYTGEAEKFFAKLGFVMDEEIDPKDTNTMVKNIN